MTRLAIAALCVVLGGCRSADSSLADHRILWSAEGCAFTVRPGVGNASFVRPIRDADKPTCKQPGVEK